MWHLILIILGTISLSFSQSNRSTKFFTACKSDSDCILTIGLCQDVTSNNKDSLAEFREHRQKFKKLSCTPSKMQDINIPGCLGETCGVFYQDRETPVLTDTQKVLVMDSDLNDVLQLSKNQEYQKCFEKIMEIRNYNKNNKAVEAIVETCRDGIWRTDSDSKK